MAVSWSKHLALVGLCAAVLLDALPASAESFAPNIGYALQQGLNTAAIASLYSLLAVAYALIHGITGRIILSFGDVAMFAAFYAAYAALFALTAGWPAGSALAVTFLVTVLGTTALGHSVQTGAFSPLIRSPSQAIMIASIGVSIVLQESMRLQSGGRDQWLPPLGAGPLIDSDFGGFSVRLSQMQAATLTGTGILLASLGLTLRSSRAGRLWRACSQNRALAQLCGVDVARVTAATAIAGAGFAAAAGWILAVSYGGVSFYMGLVLGLKALFASIIGGFGTIGGAVAGGVALAAIETTWSAFFPIVYRDVAVFLIIILILILRPEGLLGVAIRRDSEP